MHLDKNHMKPEIFSSMMKQNAMRSPVGESDDYERARLNITTQYSVNSRDSAGSPPSTSRQIGGTERKGKSKQNMLKPLFGKSVVKNKPVMVETSVDKFEWVDIEL